ncbi:hypothetical protein TUM17576_33930 [Enterobacter hormaechei]|nr:hypothetical protein TUM17576_33930 [Enterobacter hormaechei]
MERKGCPGFTDYIKEHAVCMAELHTAERADRRNQNEKICSSGMGSAHVHRGTGR